MQDYPWYEVVDCSAPILQGDFLNACPVVIPSSEVKEGEIPAEVSEYDVIVMSQSCDLLEKGLDLVLVCPRWSLEEMGNKNEFFKGKKGREALRKGNVAGYHLLNKAEKEGYNDFMVVDFRNVYGVSFDYLVKFASDKGSRLRLLPPYREHLSQAFARFFMRVGLPLDIPKFT